MCLAFLSFETHPELFALLAFNRDEFLERPTAPMHFWDAPHASLLAGKDMRAGGTWLGLTSDGRFACLTNFREVHYATDRPNRLSRGALVVDFLTAGCSPAQYVEGIDHQRFDGYNVIVGDIATRSISYATNRGAPAAVHLSPGLYGLSNGVLHQPGWAKVDKGLPRLQDILDTAAASARPQPLGNATTSARSQALDNAAASAATDHRHDPQEPAAAASTHPPPPASTCSSGTAPAGAPTSGLASSFHTKETAAAAPPSRCLHNSRGNVTTAAAASHQLLDSARLAAGSTETGPACDAACQMPAGGAAASIATAPGPAAGAPSKQSPGCTAATACGRLAETSSAPAGSTSCSGSRTGFEVPWEELFEGLMGDAARVEDPALLPQTGVDPQWEQRLSGIFVEPFPLNGGVFGTRSQTVIAIWNSGRVETRERSLDAERGTWQEVSYTFDVAPRGVAAHGKAGTRPDSQGA